MIFNGWRARLTILPASALIIASVSACSTIPPAQEAAAPPPTPVYEEVTQPRWSQTFVRDFKPHLRLERGGPALETVVPVISEGEPPTDMEVAMVVRYLRFSAAGTLRVRLGVSPYQQGVENGSDATYTGHIETVPPPDVHRLRESYEVTTTLPIPAGAAIIKVTLVREEQGDTFNQDPVIEAMRVSY